MTLLSPPFALGAAGQVLSGKLLRLAEGAAFRNAAAGVQGVSGILYGPAGTMGELTLNSNTSLTIGPFRAVVQQTQDVTQGQYLVVNDAAVTGTTAVVAGLPTMPAQDASQFRRAYVLAYVADSQVAGVASSATTDRAVLDILPGALAATSGAAVYPVVPPNALLLGELLIPPVGQAVTLTAYNPRTTTRGGILPVIADGANRPGHDGDPGTHVDQVRMHPTHGFQRWTGTAWVPVRSTSAAWALFPIVGAPYFIHNDISAAGTGVAPGGGAPGMQYRREGDRVFLRGVAYSGQLLNAASNGSNPLSTALPVEFRPPTTAFIYTPRETPGANLHRLELGSNGVLYSAAAIPAAAYFFFDDLSYSLS